MSLSEIHGWHDWLADSHRWRREDEMEGPLHQGEVELFFFSRG
jgi:hypothetical protein